MIAPHETPKKSLKDRDILPELLEHNGYFSLNGHATPELLSALYKRFMGCRCVEGCKIDGYPTMFCGCREDCIEDLCYQAKPNPIIEQRRFEKWLIADNYIDRAFQPRKSLLTNLKHIIALEYLLDLRYEGETVFMPKARSIVKNLNQYETCEQLVTAYPAYQQCYENWK